MTEKATSKAAQKRLEAQYGARWSELFHLHYYDAIRFVVIDPMHSLLLGTARHIFRLWIELGVLTTQKLHEIQRRVDSVKVPVDVGRIPRKIASGFSGFTANQWKNWTTIYSLFCLKGLIDKKHYDVWFDFVQACIIMCSRVISTERLELADRYLQTFLTKFANLYGPLYCTPNMHLHLHLKDCVLDYGPVYSFWWRFNGMLGQYSNNNRNIEVQVMRHFQETQQLYMPVASAEFVNILTSKDAGFLSTNSTTDMMYIKHYCQISSEILLLEDLNNIEPLPPFQDIVLEESDRYILLSMYHKIYPNNFVTQVGSLARMCTKARSLVCK